MLDLKTINVPGTCALDEIERLRAAVSQSGFYPVLLGQQQDYESILEGAGFFNEDFSEIIARSHEIESAQWFRNVIVADPDYYPAAAAEWPADIHRNDGIIAHTDILTGVAHESVVVGLFEVASSWEVIALLKWGGFNACPMPWEHCAIHRYWASRYGAEVIAITRDTIECLVARPPAGRAESLALAQEQYMYCSDIVEQGMESVAALAATLLDSNYWFFWWD